jgi:hypothetical protein
MVGCGGSSTSTSPTSTSTSRTLSPSAYSSELRKLGDTLAPELAAVEASTGDFSRVESNVGRGQASLRAAAARLSALDLAPDVRADNAVLVTSLRAFATELDRLKQAARRRDARKVAAANGAVLGSAPLQAMMGAARDLRAKGYDLGALGGA